MPEQVARFLAELLAKSRGMVVVSARPLDPSEEGGEDQLTP
jgi:hypothetical protein